MRRLALVISLMLVAAACGEETVFVPLIGPGPTSSLPPVSIAIAQPQVPLSGVVATPIAEGFDSPVDVASAVGDDRLFVVEKAGRVLVVRDGEILPEPFLDIRADVLSEGNEQGLVTLELHPQFATNGRAFVFYTDSDGNGRLVEFTVSQENPDRLDAHSGKNILEAKQPHEYHQSGSIAFGPEGYLWLSLGDGGGRDDRYGNGQDTTSLLASILRLDVDAAPPYAVPPDNPHVAAGRRVARSEIWAKGVRNPWRISIDATTRTLYVPDVGQEGLEEINIVPLDAADLNYGWPVVEGTECRDAGPCDTAAFVTPVVTYDHSRGCAVVGGDVYRGASMPELHGYYFYGDFCGGWVQSLVWDGTRIAPAPVVSIDDSNLRLMTSLGTDGAGEVVITTLSGGLFRLDAVRGS